MTTSGKHEAYEDLRWALASLQQEFESPIHGLSHLHHHLIWAPKFGSWSPEEYQSFVAANMRGSREHWIRWPKGRAISRFTWRRDDDCIEEFLRLRERGNRLLRCFEDFVVQSAETPDGFRFEWHGEDWIELLHDFGRRFSTSGLLAKLAWWADSSERPESEMTYAEKAAFEQHITNPVEGAPFHTHPISSLLQQDVFSASAEFIRLILDPYSVVPVDCDDGEMSIVFPAATVNVDEKDGSGETQSQEGAKAGSSSAPKKRPKRSETPDDYEANHLVKRVLDQNPKATVMQVHQQTGISTGRISGLEAWRYHMASRRAAKRPSKVQERPLTKKMLQSIGSADDPAKKLMRDEEIWNHILARATTEEREHMLKLEKHKKASLIEMAAEQWSEELPPELRDLE